MAEVPDHLVPRDGLTNSAIKFDGFEILHGLGTVRITFGIYEDNDRRISHYVFDLPLGGHSGGANGLIAEAHRQMSDVLRQWLYRTDKVRQAYEPANSPSIEEAAKAAS